MEEEALAKPWVGRRNQPEDISYASMMRTPVMIVQLSMILSLTLMLVVSMAVMMPSYQGGEVNTKANAHRRSALEIAAYPARHCSAFGRCALTPLDKLWHLRGIAPRGRQISRAEKVANSLETYRIPSLCFPLSNSISFLTHSLTHEPFDSCTSLQI